MKLYIKKFFIITIITSLTMSLALCKYSINNVFAFGDVSHPKITEKAFNAALEDEETCELNELSDEKMEFIKCYSIRPDYDEDQSLYRYHFFNREEDDYDYDLYCLENNKNAYSRMIYHYNKSIEYATGDAIDNKKSLEQLGRSLHFLQDMCCPVHIWGYEFNKTMYDSHSRLETAWDDMWKSEKIHSTIGESHVRCMIEHNDDSWRTVEDLAKHFNRETLEAYEDFIERAKSKSTLAFCTAPCEAPTLVKGWLSTKGVNFPRKIKPNWGFENDWYYIFDIPYRASYELVRLWIKNLNDLGVDVDEILE